MAFTYLTRFFMTRCMTRWVVEGLRWPPLMNGISICICNYFRDDCFLKCWIPHKEDALLTPNSWVGQKCPWVVPTPLPSTINFVPCMPQVTYFQQHIYCPHHLGPPLLCSWCHAVLCVGSMRLGSLLNKVCEIILFQIIDARLDSLNVIIFTRTLTTTLHING